MMKEGNALGSEVVDQLCVGQAGRSASWNVNNYNIILHLEGYVSEFGTPPQ